MSSETWENIYQDRKDGGYSQSSLNSFHVIVTEIYIKYNHEYKTMIKQQTSNFFLAFFICNLLM